MLAATRLAVGLGARRGALTLRPFAVTSVPAAARPRAFAWPAAARPRAFAWPAAAPIALARVRASFSSAAKAGDRAARREELVEKSRSHFARLKDLWHKYGIVAIGTYFSMYGAVLGSFYVAIDQGWVKTKKTSRGADEDFNLVTTTNKFVTLAEDLGVAKYLELEHVNSRTGSFLLAWIATKFTEPLRLAVTLAITPRIARFLGRAPKRMPKLK